MKQEREERSLFEQAVRRFRQEEERCQCEVRLATERERRLAAEVDCVKSALEKTGRRLLEARAETAHALDQGLQVAELELRRGYERELAVCRESEQARLLALEKDHSAASDLLREAVDALRAGAASRVAAEKKLALARRNEARAQQDRVDEEHEDCRAGFARREGVKW